MSQQATGTGNIQISVNESESVQITVNNGQLAVYGRMKQQTDWGAHFLRFLKDEAKRWICWREIKAQNTLLIAALPSSMWLPCAGLAHPTHFEDA